MLSPDLLCKRLASCLSTVSQPSPNFLSTLLSDAEAGSVQITFQKHFAPNSLFGKESACSTGDLGSIPGLGRSHGEGIGYPFQDSWVSLVAQLVKNQPAM